MGALLAGRDCPSQGLPIARDSKRRSRDHTSHRQTNQPQVQALSQLLYQALTHPADALLTRSLQGQTVLKSVGPGRFPRPCLVGASVLSAKSMVTWYSSCRRLTLAPRPPVQDLLTSRTMASACPCLPSKGSGLYLLEAKMVPSWRRTVTASYHQV